jgi:hypothetical protein
MKVIAAVLAFFVVQGTAVAQEVPSAEREWLLGFPSGLNASRVRAKESPFTLTDERTRTGNGFYEPAKRIRI